MSMITITTDVDIEIEDIIDDVFESLPDDVILREVEDRGYEIREEGEVPSYLTKDDLIYLIGVLDQLPWSVDKEQVRAKLVEQMADA